MNDPPIQSWHAWREAALSGTYTPLPDDRLAKIFGTTCRYGSGNLWTGTSGTLAGYIRELLRENEWMKHELETCYLHMRRKDVE